MAKHYTKRNAVRITDIDSHGDELISGSPNVWSNDLSNVRITDIDSNGDTVVTSSIDVFINDLGATRLRDLDVSNKGTDIIISGSPNVFIN